MSPSRILILIYFVSRVYYLDGVSMILSDHRSHLSVKGSLSRTVNLPRADVINKPLCSPTMPYRNNTICLVNSETRADNAKKFLCKPNSDMQNLSTLIG